MTNINGENIGWSIPSVGHMVQKGTEIVAVDTIHGITLEEKISDTSTSSYRIAALEEEILTVRQELKESIFNIGELKMRLDQLEQRGPKKKLGIDGI